MDDSAARVRMVEEQIETRGIHDPRVLDAMRSVPRHVFVPNAMQHEAYDDRPLPIGEGQTISQPYMVASMTAVLGPRETDRVLEIGTGSGYQTAILATLAAEVISVERHASLAKAAAARCAALGFRNIRVIVGDGTEGAVDWAPFDRILVTAGAPAVPETLKSQLADGGRLVIPVGPPGFQRLVAINLHGGRFAETSGEGCVFVPLIGRHGWSPDS